MGVLRSGARGNMPATAKRLASWRVLKEMLQSFLRRCSLLDVLESLTVGTCVQHFFQVLSRGGGSLAQVFACPGHNFFFPCPILRFACPVFVDKCRFRFPGLPQRLFSEYEPVVGKRPGNTDDIDRLTVFTAIPGVVPPASHVTI